MNYTVSHAFNGEDLFDNFPVEKLKMTPQQCKQYFSDGSKRDFAKSIFIKALQKVTDDIIDNNVHFKFPGVSTKTGYMYMKRTEGDKFKKAFKRGKWNDVDFITSNFTGYQLVLDIQNKKKISKMKPIYLSAKDRDRITEHVNAGKSY